MITPDFVLKSVLKGLNATNVQIGEQGDLSALLVGPDGDLFTLTIISELRSTSSAPVKSEFRPSAEHATVPAAPPPASNTPAASPAPPADEELDLRERQARQRAEATAAKAARERLKKSIDACQTRGGAPMRILGFNPHNRLDAVDATAAELGEIAKLLDRWTPDNPSPVEKNVAAKVVPPPIDAPHPASGAGPP